MSLDQNLFTLTVVPRPGEPHIVELVDPRQVVHYRKERKDDVVYDFSVFDPLTGSLLATVTAPSATSKHKTIQLYNPSVLVTLRATGIFTFRWNFTWEEHEFEWKKEECFIIRKPDPPVLVAITKDPANKAKARAVQILDYNIQRFEVHDRKGLEIVLLSALLSFEDYSEAKNAPAQPSAKAPAKIEALPPPPESSQSLVPTSAEVTEVPKRTGLERIVELQRGKLDEVLVAGECDADEYAEYCSTLLENDNIAYVVLRAASTVDIPKVLQAAQLTKRRRLTAGDRNELLQYIHYDNAVPQTRSATVDQGAHESSKGFTVRLCKVKPTPARSPGVENHTIFAPRTQLYNAREERPGAAIVNVDKGKAKERMPKTANDGKDKSREDEGTREKERKKREELARKKREKAEERRRKEAEENTKGKRIGTEVSDRRRKEKEAEERKKQAGEKKGRDRGELKEKPRGKGHATSKPSAEREMTDAPRTDSGQISKKRTFSTVHLTARSAHREQPRKPDPALRRSSDRSASTSGPLSPPFDTGLYPARSIQHLRGAPAPGTKERPYPAMQRPVTMYGAYSGSHAPPVLFPAETMPMV